VFTGMGCDGRIMRKFDADLGGKVVEMVGDGYGLQAACVALNVPRRTVRTWAAEQPDFAKALQLARRDGLEVLADEIISIGDEVEGCTDNAVVQAARLRIDARKWLLSKLHPERYGDKVELTGKDGKDLLPARPEVLVPRLMQVLAVLLPGSGNSELHSLATSMVQRLNGSAGQLTSGTEDGRED
jgi:hypothetical protein